MGVEQWIMTRYTGRIVESTREREMLANYLKTAKAESSSKLKSKERAITLFVERVERYDIFALQI